MTSATKTSALHTMSRRSRRVLVLIVQLSMTGYTSALALLEAVNSWSFLILMGCLQAFYLWILHRHLQPIMDETVHGQLDERQLTIRDRAHYNAYQIIGLVVAAMLALFVLATTFLDGSNFSALISRGTFALAVYLFFANLWWSLPASVVAWNEPDPEPDDQTADDRRGRS